MLKNLFINHFGKTKGENRYSKCNRVIILGDYFLPNYVYKNFAPYIKKEVLFEDRVKNAAAAVIQEIERTRCRLPEVEESVECYLLISELVFNQIALYYHWNCRFEYYRSTSYDVRSPDTYDELKKLTNNQQTKMIKLNDVYPELFGKQSLLLNTIETGKILGIRPNNVINFLVNISGRSRFDVEVIESNKSGSSTGNKFKLSMK